MGRRSKGADPGREFSADAYRSAAEQRWTALQALYEQQLYTLSLYVAGVAVECIFRAYRARVSREFDARHDLFELARAAGFVRIVRPRELEACAAALSGIAVRWSNNRRYRSDAAMRRWLKRAGLDRGIGGDFLKENARRGISVAGIIVSLGVAQWNA